MTRLEQALRWWEGQDNECLVPARHLKVLRRAGLIDEVEDGAYAECSLNAKGEAALKRMKEEG